MAAPAPPGQRRRRNADAPKWRSLPAEGRSGKVPAMPPRPAKAGPWLKATRDWWATIWRSPMATIWLEADMGLLHSYAFLQDKIYRGEAASSDITAAMQCADRLGLSARSRRLLQWEVSQANPAVAAPDPAPIEKARRSSKRGHLRAL